MTDKSTASLPLIHFQTRSDRSPTIRMTPEAVAAALARSGLSGVRTSVGDETLPLDWLQEAEGLVTHNEVLKALVAKLPDLRAAAPKLRWIHITSAGIESLLPLDWLPPGIILTNNSGVHAPKMRESALLGLLALHSRLPAMTSNQRKGLWAPIFTSTIAGRHLLVVGVGGMGGATAEAGKMLGMKVSGIRRSGASHPAVTQMGDFGALDSMLPEADIVVAAAPITPETKGMFNAARFARMKPGAAFYNIGRGPLVVNEDLVAALQSGHLSGALLDVVTPEPLPESSPLWGLDNLIITPHCTADDAQRYLPDTLDLAFANAGRLVRGEALRNAVDPKRSY